MESLPKFENSGHNLARNWNSRNSGQRREWTFTWNNFTKKIPECFLNFVPKIQWAAWQLERGDSGTEHYQGVMCFSFPVWFSQVMKECARLGLEGFWVEGCYNPTGAIAYCTKIDTRTAGPWTVGDVPAHRVWLPMNDSAASHRPNRAKYLSECLAKEISRRGGKAMPREMYDNFILARIHEFDTNNLNTDLFYNKL